MADPANNVAATLRASSPEGDAWDVATVTSATVVGGRVSVTWNGDPHTFPKLRQYTPVVGDTVVLGRYGGALFIVGAFG